MSNSPYRDLYVQRKDIVFPLVEMVLSSTKSTLAETLQAALREKRYLDLVSVTLDPMKYSDPWAFRQDYLLAEMFSKYPNWDLKIDRKKVALEKFSASEDQCRITNAILSREGSWSPGASAVIETARRKIERLLGPFNWNEAELGFDFGPGSTTRLRRKRSDRYYKMSGIPDCTNDALLLSEVAFKYYLSWGHHLGASELQCNVVSGNKVVTVPKNAKTDRVIAIEPCMNIFFQKGIGAMIRRRLRKKGIDLNDQTNNQKLALQGSLDGSLATIDLSSASDTISIEIVRLLLPPEWYEALNMTRSRFGVLPSGEKILYQKFSSMGNGFTFELESLIFWAICSSVLLLNGSEDHRLAVYGDDLIVPTDMSERVIASLEFAGFTVNKKKTFISGPFRESCGKHYFQGVDVTPIYVKDKVDSYPRYIWLANQIRRYARLPHVKHAYGLDTLYKPWYDLVRGRISGFWSVPRIPDGVGDGALFGDFDEVLPKKAPRGWEGWRTDFFTETRESFLPDTYPILLKALFALEKRRGQCEDSSSSLAVPLEKRRYSKAKSTVSQWPSFGPWLG